MNAAESSTELTETLPGFLNREPVVTDEFIKAVSSYILAVARKKAPDLPADIQKEVVNQTLMNLLNMSPAKFDPARGSAEGFVYGVARNAIQQVRAMYSPPGQPTRPTRRRKGKKGGDTADPAEQPGRQAPQLVSLDSDKVQEPVAQIGAREIELACDVRTILQTAPPLVATGLERMYLNGYTLSEAADGLNISRFQLSRAIDGFCEQMRMVA